MHLSRIFFLHLKMMMSNLNWKRNSLSRLKTIIKNPSIIYTWQLSWMNNSNYYWCKSDYDNKMGTDTPYVSATIDGFFKKSLLVWVKDLSIPILSHTLTHIQYYTNHVHNMHVLHTDTESYRIARLYLIIFLVPSYIFNHLLYLIVDCCLDAEHGILKNAGYEQDYHLTNKLLSSSSYHHLQHQHPPSSPSKF